MSEKWLRSRSQESVFGRPIACIHRTDSGSVATISCRLLAESRWSRLECDLCSALLSIKEYNGLGAKLSPFSKQLINSVASAESQHRWDASDSGVKLDSSVIYCQIMSLCMCFANLKRLSSLPTGPVLYGVHSYGVPPGLATTWSDYEWLRMTVCQIRDNRITISLMTQLIV